MRWTMPMTHRSFLCSTNNGFDANECNVFMWPLEWKITQNHWPLDDSSDSICFFFFLLFHAVRKDRKNTETREHTQRASERKSDKLMCEQITIYHTYFFPIIFLSSSSSLFISGNGANHFVETASTRTSVTEYGFSLLFRWIGNKNCNFPNTNDYYLQITHTNKGEIEILWMIICFFNGFWWLCGLFCCCCF